MFWVPVFLAALMMSLVTVLVARPVALKYGLVDKPGGHKLHEHHTPLVGGLAIFLSVALAWMLAPLLGMGSMNAIFAAACGLLFAIGLIDDHVQLSVKLRFAIQIVAALLLVYSDVLLLDLGYLLPDQLVILGVLAIPLTVFAVVGAINALNMIDGIDGMCGLVSFASFSLLLFVAFTSGSQVQVLLLLCVLGGVGGFLVFNMPIPGRARASIFMGDAGSTLLGFLLAYLLISLSQGEQRAMSPVVALWIFAVPLMDTLGVMLRRVWLKKSPFAADRGHIHHLLTDAGFRVRQTVVCMSALQLVLGATGLAAYYLGVPDAASLAAFFLLFAAYVYLISRPWRIVPRFRSLHSKTGLTVAGVKHVYVGMLNPVTAMADIEALLGGSKYSRAFEIHQGNSEGEGVASTAYALVNARETDNVPELLACLRRNLVRMQHQGAGSAATADLVVRQYIPRKLENDRRYTVQSDEGGGNVSYARRQERRAQRHRLVYRSEYCLPVAKQEPAEMVVQTRHP